MNADEQDVLEGRPPEPFDLEPRSFERHPTWKGPLVQWGVGAILLSLLAYALFS